VRDAVAPGSLAEGDEVDTGGEAYYESRCGCGRECSGLKRDNVR